MSARERLAAALWWTGVVGLAAALYTATALGVAASLGTCCLAIGLDNADG